MRPIRKRIRVIPPDSTQVCKARLESMAAQSPAAHEASNSGDCGTTKSFHVEFGRV